MKKQLIAIGLVSFLAVPSVVFAEGDACAPIMSEGMTEEAVMAAKSAAMDTSECMGQRLGSIEDFSHGHGVSLYGSFRTGLVISNGETDVGDLYSRWGFQGSAEVSEGLTAAFRYEGRLDTANAESSGDAGRGRLSYVDLSGGFGAIRLGQIWSASANHYYFKIDPSHYSGTTGGASTRNPNSISYSTSAGDVSFQIDKVTTGDNERVEFGATAALGPIGVGLGYWSNTKDDASFTGVALSSGAAGVNLTIGLGSKDSDTGVATDISVISVGGSVGDSGITYGVQITNSDDDADDQNLVALTSSLGSGASLIFEIADPGGASESTSIIGLRVDF